LAATALTLVTAVAALLLAAAALGYQRYVVTGGSMTGAIPRGSLVFDKAVATASLEPGDVITYKPPAGYGRTALVTHRIVAVGAERDGARVFRTKGDANGVPDPWRVVLPAPTQARVVLAVPYAGYLLALLTRPPVRFVLIGVPALLLAVSLLWGLWEETSAAVRPKTSRG
jgi:signal peptidase